MVAGAEEVTVEKAVMEGGGLDVADGNVGQGHPGNLPLQTGNHLIPAGCGFRAGYPF